MVVKAINNLVKLNKIVLTLLVFSAYPRLTEMDPLFPSVTKRTEAIYTATKEIRCLYIERQVKDVLAIYNSPNTKKNFIFIEFKQLANLIAIKIKEVLVEAYNSVGLVKRYYTPL